MVVTEERSGGRHKGTETIMSGLARAVVARRWPEACARHGRRAATPPADNTRFTTLRPLTKEYQTPRYQVHGDLPKYIATLLVMKK